MAFQLPLLPFPYDAFEPYIDAKTMELHYTKHHQTYIDQLNGIVEKYSFLQNKTVETLVSAYQTYEPAVITVLRNHGGGHLNHTFFWSQMHPDGQRTPGDILEKTIIAHFGSFAQFKADFEQAARSVFGSGWAWICIDEKKKVKIMTTSNQDNPLMYGCKPIMGLDVWEHAYYLKYQNRRADYIASWWQVLDWRVVEKCYVQYTDAKGQK